MWEIGDQWLWSAYNEWRIAADVLPNNIASASLAISNSATVHVMGESGVKSLHTAIQRKPITKTQAQIWVASMQMKERFVRHKNVYTRMSKRVVSKQVALVVGMHASCTCGSQHSSRKQLIDWLVRTAGATQSVNDVRRLLAKASTLTCVSTTSCRISGASSSTFADCTTADLQATGNATQSDIVCVVR